MDFSAQQRFHGPTITPHSRESVGIGTRSTTVSAAWPQNNRAIYVPFQIFAPYPVRRLFWANGATVAGNVDCGITMFDTGRIVNVGSTAQAGTNALQSVALSSTLLLTPGRYYMALALSSTSGTIMRSSPGVFACINMGMIQSSAALPIPVTALFSIGVIASSYLPIFGLSSASVI